MVVTHFQIAGVTALTVEAMVAQHHHLFGVAGNQRRKDAIMNVGGTGRPIYYSLGGPHGSVN